MKLIIALFFVCLIPAGCSLSPVSQPDASAPSSSSAGEVCPPPAATPEPESAAASPEDAKRAEVGRTSPLADLLPQAPSLNVPFGDMLAPPPTAVVEKPAEEAPRDGEKDLSLERAYAPDDGTGEPSLKLLSFDEGGKYSAGASCRVEWRARGLGGMNSELYVEFYDGRGWRSLWRGDPAEGLYLWKVPFINSNNCKIRVVAYAGKARLVAESVVPFTVENGLASANLTIEIPALSSESDTNLVAEEPPKPQMTIEPNYDSQRVNKTKPSTRLEPTKENAETPQPQPDVKYPERGRVVEKESVVQMTIEIPEEPGSTALKSPEPIVDTKEPETSSSAPQPTENEPPKDISARVDLRKYLTFGLNAFDEGRYDRAVDNLRQYLDKYPNEVEALFALGRAYYHLCRYQDAEQTFSKLVSIKDDHAGAYYYLGKISLNSQVYSLSDQEHRSEAAIQRFEKAISLDPKYAAAYNDLGKMYFDESKYEKALGNFEKAVENETANKIYLYNAGRGSFAINNYNKTIDYCLKAAKLDPTFCYPYWFVAKSYSLLEKWSEAALYWAKAVDLFSFDKRLQAEALRELAEAESHLK